MFLVGLAVARVVGRVRPRSLGLSRVEGLLWRDGVYYSPGHVWLQWKGDRAVRIGLDDLGQHVFAKITEVILPEPGQLLQAGQAAAVIRAGRRRAVIPAPVAGKVVAVNRRLLRNPSLLHNNPYADGWLYAVEPNRCRLHPVALRRSVAEVVWRRGAALLAASSSTNSAWQQPTAVNSSRRARTLLTDEQWQTMTKSFLQSPPA